tara:strand:- start:4391 stop:4681 length:291 start_codon:yes stop_codon:yes gene_type:complete
MFTAFIRSSTIGTRRIKAKIVNGSLNFFEDSGMSPVLISEGINKCAAAIEKANAATKGAKVQIEVRYKCIFIQLNELSVPGSSSILTVVVSPLFLR